MKTQSTVIILGLDLNCVSFSTQVSVPQCRSDNTVKRAMAKSKAARVSEENQASAAEICEWK